MSDTAIPTPSFAHRTRRWISQNLVRIYAIVAFIYLFIPVAYTFAYSFNDAGRSNLVWQGFTLNNWKNPCGAPHGFFQLSRVKPCQIKLLFPASLKEKAKV